MPTADVVTCKLVDSIATTPGLRLDLNSGAFAVSRYLFPPPPVRRSIVVSGLVDGERVASSTLGNQIIELDLTLRATSQDALATAYQALHRELDRETNILQWQTGGTHPVFFRVWRSPDYQPVDQAAWFQGGEITLRLLAEPGAYGAPVDLTATVANDPASANGGYLDILGVKGDLPAECLIFYKAAGGLIDTVALGVRRGRGSTFPGRYLQCDALTLGADTAPAADANASGGTAASTSFATDASMVSRLATRLPANSTTQGPEARGTYRVFARVAQTVAGNAFAVRLVSPRGVANDTVLVAANDTSYHLFDLGLAVVPAGKDPIHIGPAGVESSVWAEDYFSVEAERTGGAGSLKFDTLFCVFADTEFAMIGTASLSGANPDYLVLDSFADREYVTGGSPLSAPAYVKGPATPSRTGKLPLLSPGDNRLIFLRQVNGPADESHSLTATTSVSVRYWPRYGYLRPAST